MKMKNIICGNYSSNLLYLLTNVKPHRKISERARHAPNEAQQLSHAKRK